MKISDRIKTLRIEYNFTQKELAEKLGLTPKMISFYEKAERTPPIDIVLKLVTIFNVSSDYLLGLIDTKYNIENACSNVKCLDSKSKMRSARSEELMIIFDSLSSDGQDIIMGKAKDLLREERLEQVTLKKVK